MKSFTNCCVLYAVVINESRTFRSAAGRRQGGREKIVICQCWNESRKPAICVRETDRERGGWVGMDTC